MPMKTPRYNFDLPALKAADRIMELVEEYMLTQGLVIDGKIQGDAQLKAKIQVLIVDLLQEDHAGTHAELLEARQRAGRAEDAYLAKPTDWQGCY